MSQTIIVSTNLADDIAKAVADCSPDRLFILTDDTTRDLCLPLIPQAAVEGAHLINIPPTDAHKDLESLTRVWQQLATHGATRHSCMINLGGGMVTDLGGFAAATFKRGFSFINIPTTLLAMVDASVGGKTGINFQGLKNEVGVFSDAQTVIINTNFLRTLDADNLTSGYAEMLKHGLISNTAMWSRLIAYDLDDRDLQLLQTMVAESIGVKQNIVDQDPHEQGLRKALNLGHTIGHAIEALALKKQQPLLHGHAVAAGLVCELYIACLKTGFPADKMRQTTDFIRRYYAAIDVSCYDYNAIYEFMTHDKKNSAGRINFTLLADIGDIRINQTATRDEIFEALDFYREG